MADDTNRPAAGSMEQLLHNLCGDEIDALLDVRAALAGALAILNDDSRLGLAQFVAESEALHYVLRLLRRADEEINDSIGRHDQAAAAAHQLVRHNVVSFCLAAGTERARDPTED